MKYMLQQLAETAPAEKAGMFEALGIDWKLLILQSVAFLLLVWLLGKFVYPRLIKMIDDRQAKIDESVQAAEAAQKKAEAAEDAVERELAKARKESASIIETARQEAADIVAASEEKAASKAEHIVNEAKGQLEGEITRARQALKQETVSLVAQATEQIIRKKIDAKEDAALIENALEEGAK